MAKLERVMQGEGYVDSYYSEGQKIWRVREQTDRAQILRQNELMRQDGGSLKGDGMRLALQIPQDDYAVIVAAFPELQAGDRDIKRRAWERFMRLELSAPYRVYNAKRGDSA